MKNLFLVPLLANGTLSQREDLRSSSASFLSNQTFAVSPPPVCWGENRAKFSDVVARNQENSSPFSSYSPKLPMTTSYLDHSEYLRRDFVRDLLGNELNHRKELANNCVPSDSFMISQNNQSQSLFANSFREPPVSFIFSKLYISEPEIVKSTKIAVRTDPGAL